MSIFSGDELYDDDVTSGPIENFDRPYDHEAERNSMWCDQCGVHHGGDCPPDPNMEEDD